MIENHIRQLASRKDFTGPFLSLYIDTNRNDEAHRDRIRLFMKNEMQKLREELGGNGHAAHLEQGIRRIEQYFENELRPETRGVVIFSAPSENFFVPLQLPVPVEPEISIGTTPKLRQLARLSEQDHPVAIVLVDAKNARLMTSVFGRMVAEVDIESTDVPRRHDQGGWSQAGLQRHMQDHIDRHHKEVADYLSRMIESGGWLIVLGGQERNVSNFRDFLPKRLQDKIIGSVHLDIRASHGEISDAVSAMLTKERTTKTQERLQAAITAAEKHARGAAGFRQTIDAANQKKLDTLFLSSDASALGWCCASCHTLGEAIPLGACPLCGGKTETVDLVEALIRAAQNEDAEVAFVDRSDLSKYDGVAAALRF